MLYPVAPVPHVPRAVRPVHLAEPVPLVFSVLALVQVAACPHEYAVAVLLVGLVVPFILVDAADGA